MSSRRVLTKDDFNAPVAFVMKAKPRKLNAYIPADEYQLLKIIAAKKNLTLTEIVNKMVQDYIKDER